MVEKIIINPEEVRGLGNIMSPHSSSDYEVYMSSITTGTDTVNGQTMTVYELEDTIIFYDSGVQGTKNTDWENYSNRLSITVDSTGTLVSKGSSNGFYYADNGSTFTDYIAEFDVVSCSAALWYHSGQSSTSQNIINLATYFNDGGHCKIVSDNGVAKVYKDGTQVGTDITITATAPSKIGFRVNTGTEERSIKYKNFKVYL